MSDFTNGNGNEEDVLEEEDDVFKDEACNQHVEKITHFLELVQIEEEKLYAAMENAKKSGSGKL